MPKKSAANLEDNAGNTPIFIRAYGEFWNPDLVNWEKIGPREKRWRLLGIDGHGKTIDCYEQRASMCSTKTLSRYMSEWPTGSP
jgi:hypothetical protein